MNVTGGLDQLVGAARRAGAAPQRSSAGRRITIAAGESFNVKRNEELEEALGRWIEE